jgi:sugar (pentulose or hexulose) kinase
MANGNYLIFDFGASNGRAIVAQFDGKRFSMEVTHRFENSAVVLADTHYWDFLRLFSELKMGLRLSMKKFPDIASLGVDTWGCDFGFIDGNGRLLANPVTYRNPKRHERSQKLYEILPRRELFELSAGATVEIMGIYQLFSFSHEDATELRSAHRFLMLPDLFNFFLTGRACNEYSDATMALLCDQRNRTWEPKIMRRLRLPMEIFGEIVMPGSEVGRVNDEVRRELAVPGVRVIAPATHDTASAVVGIPVVARDTVWAFISVGTWCIAGVETNAPVITDAAFESGYGNNATADGRNMLVKYIAGLWIIQQCREKWNRGSAGPGDGASGGAGGRTGLSWDEIVILAERAKSTGSFIDVDDPVYGLPQEDMPGVIVDYCRKTRQTPPGDIGEIARCVYESIVLSFRRNLRILEGVIGRKIQLLHLMGGGTQNKLLCQWTADAVGVPVIAGPMETTSVGNLIMQLKAAGEISGVDEGRQISLDSSTVSHYHPRDEGRWDDAYGIYGERFFTKT